MRFQGLPRYASNIAASFAMCVASLQLGACAATHGTAKTARDAGRAVTVSPVSSEEEYTAARADFDALADDDASRGPRRRALLDYELHELASSLDHARADEAEGALRQALSLYSPEELRAAAASSKPADKVQPLLAAAERFEVAFRKRGAHLQVLLGLTTQLSLGGAATRADARKRYDAVVAWLDGPGGGASVEPDENDSPSGSARVIFDLESIARVLPSPFVVDELASRYRQPMPSLKAEAEAGRVSLRRLTELVNEDHPETRAYELARVFLRVLDPIKARDELRAMTKKDPLHGDDDELLQLLEKITGKDASATDWVGLAMFIVRQKRERGTDDRDVALRVCQAAESRFAKAVEPHMCVGELALKLDDPVVAMHAFEAVRTIDPSNLDAWKALAAIYQGRLFQLVTEENLDVNRLPAELARVEAFHAEAQKRFPQQPLEPGMAAALFEVGRGYYNAGRIDEAEKYLGKSIDLEANAPALELEATVRQKRGDPQRAAVLLERAIASDRTSRQEEQLYHRARLRRLLADAIEAAGDAPTAERTRRGAVEDWDVLLGLGLQREFASEALLERGKVLYQLGDRDEALRSMERSIDALPDRGSAYADVIAFLVPRGELNEVLDLYHRALGRSEVNDYLKVYCSLWILDLGQRAGQPEDPLALAYLRQEDGGKWYDDLARWATGREQEKDLLARANTPSRQAEAAFYRAMKALREGHPSEAKQLWAEVIKTNMMAFFEYDMADMYLKDGAPTHPRTEHAIHHHEEGATPTPPAPRPQRGGDAPPDGSI